MYINYIMVYYVILNKAKNVLIIIVILELRNVFLYFNIPRLNNLTYFFDWLCCDSKIIYDLS